MCHASTPAYTLARRMTDFLRVFEGKALAEELTRAGHSVSEKTVQRWKSGITKPKPQDIRAIRELVGATLPDMQKEAPPRWARELTDDLTNEIRENRRVVLESMSEALAEELARYGFERALGEQSDDAPALESEAKPPAGVGRQ